MEQDAFDVGDLDLDDVDDGPDDGDDEFDDAVLDEFDQNVIGAGIDQSTYDIEGKEFIENSEWYIFRQVCDDIENVDADLFEQMNHYGMGSSHEDDGYDWLGPASDLMILYF